MTYDIAIIMVSYNKILDECLPSVVKAMESTSLRTCFVLVDNGSDAFSAHEHVKKHIPDSVVILRNKNFGFGNSSNRGAVEVDAEHYFFLNPDTRLPDPLILEKLHTFLQERPWAGIVAPRVHYLSGELQETYRRFPRWYMPILQRTKLMHTNFAKRYAESFLMRDVSMKAPRLIDWAQGSALFMSAKLFHELRGFDDRFWMYFEDIDLCRRSWEAHRPVYFTPETFVHHAYGKGSAIAGGSGGYIRNFLKNRVLREHVASWLKYLWKWRAFSGSAITTKY